MHCQKCRTPLKLDSSLEELNPAAYDLLVGKLRRLMMGPASVTFARSDSYSSILANNHEEACFLAADEPPGPG